MEIKLSKFGFNNINIIENLQLTIEDKDKIAIIGKNGIGKSTLFNIIVGKYKSKIETNDLKNFGYFGKDSNLNYESTLKNEIELFRNEINFNNYEKLKNGLSFNEFENKKIKNLSQGNKIKSELIFILSNKYKEVYFLDEPTESLDKESILFLSSYIKKSNNTFVIISHDKEFVNNFSTKKFILENKTLLKYE